jgi:hypothetical protein
MKVNIMHKLLDWIKTHKLTTVLLVIVVYFVYRNFYSIPILGGLSQKAIPSYYSEPTADISYEMGASEALRTQSIGGIIPPLPSEAPPTETTDRLVVRETNISLLVEDVRQTSDEILNYVEGQGGYMVSTTITQPEEAPYGTIVVRVPSEKLRETMERFRSLAIKVSSEYITGRDVTDEYEDIEARLETLEKTKAKFEAIMDQAVKIDDILRVQREIISLQSQIDNLKGRQLYLEQTAKLARITINMSTDEIALPYTPSEAFRPKIIFKLAWRSLVRNLRKIATTVIWIAVYAVIWVPVLGIIVLVKRWWAKRSSIKPQQ